MSLSAGGQAFSAQWVPPDGCTDDAGRCRSSPSPSRPRSRSAQPAAPRWYRSRPSACAGPPPLFDLGKTCRRFVPSSLGLDAGDPEIAQALYRDAQGHDVPAFDSGYLPESMFAEVPTVLDSLLKTDPSLGRIMGQLDRPGARSPGTMARSRRTTASSRRSNPRTSLP